MFKKKQPPQPDKKKGSGAALAKQLGFLNSNDGDDSLDDNDLLAELEQITGGTGGGKGKPSNASKKPNAAALFDIEKMAAASMKDIGSDEDVDDGLDPEDDDLLNELMGLEAGSDGDEETASPAGPASPVKVVAPPTQVTSSRSTVDLIAERLQMYTAAEEAARTSGDGSKAKRMERGIKTLNDQLKAAKAGKAVAVDDIPPPVAGPSKTPTTSPQHKPSQPDVVQKPTAEPPAWQRPASNDQNSIPVSPSGARVPPTPAPKPVQPPAPAPKPVQPPTPAAKSTQPPAPAPKPMVAPTPAAKPASVPMNSFEAAAAAAAPKKVASGHDEVQARRSQYKQAALDAKNSGDLPTAKKYMVIVKQFDMVLEAMDNGQPVDLSQMPPPLTASSSSKASVPAASAAASARPAASGMSQSVSTGELAEIPPIPELSQEAKEKLFHAPAGASSVMEALQQRLDKFRSTALSAKEEGNSSKARRLDRIVQQYEDAIKQHKAGKPVDYDSLPAPPGFPPIPVPSAPAPTAAPAPAAAAPVSSQPQRPTPAAAPPVADKPKPKAQMSRSEQQLALLKERHQELRRAAQTAKKDGDLQMAKDYLRLSLGLEKMITAAESGLPVDMTQVPPAPSSASDGDDFELLTADDVSSDRDDMYKKLEEQLVHQIQVCMTNASHYSKMGDVGGANRFEKMLANDQKDLDALRQANRQGHPVPQFHYEAKTFSLVQSFPELGDNDFELTIVRGINYSIPSGFESKDLDTYVVFEFPFPTEVPQKGETATFRHTHNPEYKQTFKLQADRKSRVFLRVLKAKAIKLEVYYKRGFLKKDQLLGSASVKLVSLENSCLLHESYDLMDGRKAVGGKVEVRVRVREPYVSKQVEQTREKWLIIDRFIQRPGADKLAMISSSVIKSPSNNSLGKVSAVKQSPSESPAKRASDSEWTSIEVLKFEKHLLDQQMERYKGKLTPGEVDALTQKGAKLARDARDMDTKLKAGGRDAQQGYVRALEAMLVSIGEEVRTLVQQGNRDKAQVLLAKKKLVEKEIDSLKA